MALQAESVCGGGAQQVIVFAAMRLVAGGATLGERRLVMVGLLRQVANVAMAAQAYFDRIGFWQPWLPTRVWAVAVRAVACRPGMLHLRSFDQLGLIVVASNAKCFGI